MMCNNKYNNRNFIIDSKWINISSYRKKKHIEIMRKYPLNLLKKRELDSHKGTYGKVAIIGGSLNMSGAVILEANAAIRTGSGLVNCVVPECILERVASNIYEATYTPLKDNSGTIKLTSKDIHLILENYDAVSIGVGLGNKRELLESIDMLISYSRKPIVIDADGLNILSLNIDILRKNLSQKVVLTPHPLEMSRLTGLSVDYINSHREEVAKNFAYKYNCILLLKGNETIVSDGDRIYKNKSGHPAMATGGSGDVLTGIILSLLGQGYDLYDSAVLGSCVHGLTGGLAYNDFGYGVKASDLTNYIGYYVK